ncbi:MAG TPA: pyridoxamine 5'-phosphate oxidase family protein [Candidatus Acidoferrales bacterium]|nr:pyridoxamine 5'-phosphate oxidase family protein [Candidatus Acidoferrales bacterium]
MTKIDGICKEVIDKAEWIAIATTGPDGPHLVATWGDQLRACGINNDTLLIPVGHMHKTEANVSRDNRVELICGTRQVQGTHGPGKGCGIVGKAEFHTGGPHFDAIKAKFRWARAALVVNVEEAKSQL